jgi:hypothetical protein
MHAGVYATLTSKYGRSGLNAPEMLMLIESHGGDTEQLWYEHKLRNGNNELLVLSQHRKAQLMKAIDLILRHSSDGWFVLCHLTSYVLNPTIESTVLLQTMLHSGLSPNLELLCFLRGYQFSRPLLYHAICRAVEKTRLGYKEGIDCIVSLIVEYGANIHYILPETFDGATKWYDLATLWTLAYNQEFETVWFNGLHGVGADVDEYQWEDIRRRKQAIRLRGATRSGVDEQVLELPSISGLRCRKCRKYCKKHNRGILDDREWDEYEDRQREKRERKAV